LAGSSQPEEEEEDPSGAHHLLSPVFKLSFNHPKEKERKKERDCKERNKLSAFTRLLLTGDICY